MIWLTKIFSATKAYVFLGIGLLVTGLTVAVKFLASRNKTLKTKVKTSEARVEHALSVMEADKEIDEQADVRLIEAKNEIKNTGGSSTFRDPNKLFDGKDSK